MLKLLLIVVLLSAFSVFNASAQTSCDFCKAEFGPIMNLLENNTAVAEIQEHLLWFCSLLPSPNKDLCAQNVPSLLQQFVHLAKILKTPERICQMMQACPTLVRSKSKDPSEACKVCNYLVGSVSTWVKDNATDAEILQFLQTACNTLPSGKKLVCELAVKEYGEKFIQMLRTMDPTKVCQRLKVCPTASVLLMKQEGPAGCFLCKYVMKTLEDFISSNTTEAEIIEFASKMCSALPSKEADMCQKLMKQYLPQVIQLLLNKESPEVICASVSLCAAQPSFWNIMMNKRKVAAKVDPTTCSVCQFLMFSLESYITANITEDALMRYAESFCSTFGSMAATCQDFVAKQLPLIIKFVIARENPLKLCQRLQVCAAKLNKVNAVSVVTNN